MKQKSIALHREEQQEAFREAEAAVRNEFGDGVSAGDIIAEISACYVGIESPIRERDLD